MVFWVLARQASGFMDKGVNSQDFSKVMFKSPGKSPSKETSFSPNADCAEDFDISGETQAEPGTVMVFNDAGELAASTEAYDRRVTGVVSGAGQYRPAIVLDRRETGVVRQPIALLGKTFCKVDAQFGAIAVGDLLTTSPTPGHAMATKDPVKSFGAVIGKAMRPLSKARGSFRF